MKESTEGLLDVPAEPSEEERLARRDEVPVWNLGRWRMPSGRPLTEFALSSGFLAPRVLNPKGSASAKRLNRAERASGKTKE